MSQQDGSPEASYDPMRQFAELAGDVRDPYPMLAGIRADTPVLHVQLSTGPGGRYQHDDKAPRITSLFTITSPVTLAPRSIRMAASWTRGSVRPVRTTLAPASPSAWLMAKPRPLVPPVTRVRIPSRSGDGSVTSPTLP